MIIYASLFFDYGLYTRLNVRTFTYLRFPIRMVLFFESCNKSYTIIKEKVCEILFASMVYLVNHDKTRISFHGTMTILLGNERERLKP